MKKSLEKRALDSTIAGGLQFFLTILNSIALVPFFLTYWGKEKYGIWVSILAFTSLLKTFDLGHQNFVGNEFQRFFHTEKEKAKIVLGSGVRIALLLGFLETLAFLVIILIGADNRMVGISAETSRAGNVNAGILVMLISWWLTGSIGGILVRIILPLGLYAKSIYISLVYKVFEIALLLVCSIYNSSLLWVCVLYSLASVLNSFYLMWYIKGLLPAFFPWWQKGSWKTGLDNLAKSSVLTINNLVDQLNTSGIILFVSSFLTAAAVPVFTTIRMISNMMSQLAMIVTNPMVPDLIRLHSQGQGYKIRQIFSTSWFLSNFIVNLPVVMLVPFITKLYGIWTNNTLQFKMPLFLLLALSVCFTNFGRSHINYLTGINHLKALSTISATRFVTLFAVSLALLPRIEMEALGWGILAAEVLASFILPTIYVRISLKDIGTSLDRNQERLALLSIVSIIVYFIGVTFYPQIDLLLLLAPVLAMLIIANIQWKNLDEEVKSRIAKVIVKR